MKSEYKHSECTGKVPELSCVVVSVLDGQLSDPGSSPVWAKVLFLPSVLCFLTFLMIPDRSKHVLVQQDIVADLTDHPLLL